jgi:hypothetical protein
MGGGSSYLTTVGNAGRDIVRSGYAWRSHMSGGQPQPSLTRHFSTGARAVTVVERPE